MQIKSLGYVSTVPKCKTILKFKQHQNKLNKQYLKHDNNQKKLPKSNTLFFKPPQKVIYYRQF